MTLSKMSANTAIHLSRPQSALVPLVAHHTHSLRPGDGGVRQTANHSRTMPTIPICTYCNSLATTIDHVPPSLIFPKPRPANIITVPACYDCNNSASLDDEYFRLVTALEEKSGEHPDSIELLPVIIRSLNRRQAQGFRKTFARSQFDCDIFTESGLFLKSAIGYNVDKDRLKDTSKFTRFASL